jgi:periplasmic copper chaperone A
MLRRLTLLATLVAASVVALASPAMAHVELEPEQATAGATETLTFSFHHGKDGAATTALEVQLPEGTAVVEVGQVDGFTASQDESTRTVRWEGGPVPDGVEARFPLTVTLPVTTGVVLFPTIQETEAGELAWIGEEEGEGEDSSPAPRLTLGADPNATTTSEPSPTTTDAPVTSTTADLPGTTVEAANEGDGDAAAPWLIGAGLAAVAAVAIGGTLLKRGMDRDEADAEVGAPDGSG